MTLISKDTNLIFTTMLLKISASNSVPVTSPSTKLSLIRLDFKDFIHRITDNFYHDPDYYFKERDNKKREIAPQDMNKSVSSLSHSTSTIDSTLGA
jgi:hypothetical protein